MPRTPPLTTRRALVSWRLSPTCNPGEVMTDMPYVIYPAGLSLALRGAGALGVPLYITETGIADAGDARRALLIDAYMAEVRAKPSDMGAGVAGRLSLDTVLSPRCPASNSRRRALPTLPCRQRRLLALVGVPCRWRRQLRRATTCAGSTTGL